MRIYSFRLSLLASLSVLLLWNQSFGRCESSDTTVENGHVEGTNDGDQNLPPSGNEEADSNSASGSVSEDEPEDPEDLYFYFFDKESVVTEYEALPDSDEKEEPDFLYHPVPGHIRIVEFYAHWCPHCANFRPKYNAFAKNMIEIAERNKLHLDVYAVSCVPHRQLCRDQNIEGYPRVKLFLGDTEGIEIPHGDLHPFTILQTISEKMKITISDTFSTFEKEESEENGLDQRKELSVSGSEHDSASTRVTRFEIYSDAYLSFHFAMKHSIFVGRDPPNENARDAFRQWIELLDSAVPPSWPLKAMLGDITNNIETVLDSEENLFNIVDKYPPPRKRWSQSCSRGGYTCGLWRLFHIATVGLVEWNIHNVEDLDYTPRDVSLILRNYIENFFACEVCRINFLRDFDNCEFHRCERLSSETGSLSDWKELPLWLFEVHNGVTSRLLKERAEREKFEVSHEQLLAAEWPAREDCPLCWHGDGRFDPDVVYSFLKLSYWPDELLSSTEYRKLLATTGNKEDDVVESGRNPFLGLIPISFLLMLFSVQVQKQRRMHQTGKHKKADDNDFIEVKMSKR